MKAAPGAILAEVRSGGVRLVMVLSPLLALGAGCSLVLDFGGTIDPAVDSAPPLGDPDSGPDAAGCTEETTFYADVDRDGFGDLASPTGACEAPPGHVADSTDCDDGDPARHPEADDVCNDLDDDCNDVEDDGLCLVGCADGEREGFADVAGQPGIAGCSGGFDVPGLIDAVEPSCGRAAGDDGEDPAGAGCGAADLCAAGWHVCATPAEVAASAAGATCAGAVPAGSPPLFFANRQSGGGGAECGAGTNDIFGCGSLGGAVAASCAPLDRFSSDLCAALQAPWNCGADGLQEAVNVTKPGPSAGGVLCCRERSGSILSRERRTREETMERIQIGYQAFVSDGGEEFGAIRDVQSDRLIVYVENAGDFVVPLDAVEAVHSQKVVFASDKLDASLREAIGHAHDAEQPGV